MNESPTAFGSGARLSIRRDTCWPPTFAQVRTRAKTRPVRCDSVRYVGTLHETTSIVQRTLQTTWPTPKKETPTKDNTEAGATSVVVDNRSSIASEILNSTVPDFPKIKSQRHDLPLGAGQVFGLWIVGSFAVSSDKARTSPGLRPSP